MDIEKIRTISRSSVVIIGNFNPAIFHPEWFDRNQVLPPQEVRDIAQAKPIKIDALKNSKVKFIGSNVFVSAFETRLSLPSYNILINPERFEASTSNGEKRTELCKFVASTFKVLEHIPVTSIGINFLSSLRFSLHAKDLMERYFCAKPEAISSVFGPGYVIDSSVRFSFEDSRVRLELKLIEASDEIGINFNYDKKLTEERDTKELIKHLLNNFEPMMLNADAIIKELFGEPTAWR